MIDAGFVGVEPVVEFAISDMALFNDDLFVQRLRGAKPHTNQELWRASDPLNRETRFRLVQQTPCVTTMGPVTEDERTPQP